MRNLKWATLLLSCHLLGCLAVNPESIRTTPGRAAIGRTSDRTHEFDLSSPAEAHAELAANNRENTEQLLLQTPPGAQVHLVDDLDRRYLGTLLSASPDELQLKNCICREVVAAPDGQQQCKTSHVPFQTLKTESLTHVTVVSPPSPNFESTDADDTSDVTVDTLVFKSGRRQRWGQPADPGLINRAIEASDTP